MKKLLLCGFMFAAFNLNAQTTLFFDDFDDGDISDWNLIDADQDGYDWVPADMSAATPAYLGMRSQSWDALGGPLTPDNWAISPGIDVGLGGNTITLSWEIIARDPAWDQEKYAVYVSNGNSDSDMLLTTPVMVENNLDGVNTLTLRQVTLPSNLTGTIYVGFRHYDVSDQFVIDVDNVTVTSTPLKTDDFFASNFSIAPNPASDYFTISTKNNITVENVQIMDMNGRVVKNIQNSFDNQSNISISDLNTGVYFVKVKSQNGVGTSKIVKK